MAEVLRHWLAGDDYQHKSGGFMGKTWDSFVPGPAIWRECLRVLKPGGHLLAFFGTRTQDMGTLAIRLAGFEIRDSISWVYGSGFPKSMDVSKAIDKAEDYKLQAAHRRAWVEAVQEAGLSLPGNSRHDWTVGEHAPGNKWWAEFEAWLPGLSGEKREAIERIVVGKGFKPRPTFHTADIGGEAEANEYAITTAATDAARQWQGWGTALKPALEPITVARKPLTSASINVLQMVESQLRERGVRGGILWKPEPASVATKKKRQINSSSTEAQKVVGTYAESAAASETQSAGQKTETSFAPGMLNGANQTVTMSASTTSKSETSCGTKCSQPTAGNATAAEKLSATFSLSTTSTAAEPSTENPCMARSTTSSSETDSRLDTECFAGIATGLTGSMAHVLIKRDASGFYLWPRDLPEYVPGTPLTVAANVLEHGTGALNIDGCRVGDFQNTTPSGVDRRNAALAEAGYRPGAYQMGEKTPDTPPGRWPANLILSIPEDEYSLRDDVTPDQLRQLAEWMDANP